MRSLLLAIFLCVTGCVAQPTPERASPALTTGPIPATTGPALDPPILSYDRELDASIAPPPGWEKEPDKATSSHLHRVWLSPTGDTAYGVIRFKLPLPMTDEVALWGFMREMKRDQGESILVEKSPDPNGRGLRFVAEGGKYKVRSRLTTSGFRGWCVYAGTLRGRTDNVRELTQATAARDATRFGSGNK